eukprot:scaffold21317_cov112-Isochrysis_galbana.AAC.1
MCHQEEPVCGAFQASDDRQGGAEDWAGQTAVGGQQGLGGVEHVVVGQQSSGHALQYQHLR